MSPQGADLYINCIKFSDFRGLTAYLLIFSIVPGKKISENL